MTATPPHRLRRGARLPNSDVRADVASVVDRDDLIGHARCQARHVSRLDDLVQLRPNLRGETTVEITPHFRMLDVRVHSRNRRWYVQDLLFPYFSPSAVVSMRHSGGRPSGRLKTDDRRLIGLVRGKLAIPGNDPLDVSDEKHEILKRQVPGQLRAVLREADYVAFDLYRAFGIVAHVAAVLR